MPESPKYAVVDIETTGTDAKKDRIIQFGCVFVEGNQIVSRFATDINPAKKINKQIQNLTGITNEQVANAPYMEDVAQHIYQLLENTIFVAHNIYFDYQFLNKELMRCGCPPLKIAGIDTVELTQIFFPTLSSFRLSDLAEQLHISHERPHQADSDAEVTALLLIEIEKKITSLPLLTIERIVSLADQCGMQTKEYIVRIYETMQMLHSPLPENCQIIGEIALQKKILPIFDYEDQIPAFPKKQKQKEQLYDGHFDYRKEQGKMMNLVYEFFQEHDSTNESLNQKNLAIEASTGMGKTFAYLLPMSYLATPENPVVISTVSVLLENQIVQQAIPLVNQIRPQRLSVTLLKSHRHFIDLERFVATLKHPVKQKQYALHQMGVLVWLTETITGDLDELHLSTMKHLFFQHVQHRGAAYLSEDSPYFTVDFWLFLQKKIKQSNVIVVNHSFLVQENYRSVPLLPPSDCLIVDEAHHLPEIAQQIGLHQVSDYQISKLLDLFVSEEHQIDGLVKMKKEKEWATEARALNTIFTELDYMVTQVKEDIIEQLLIDGNRKYNEEVVVSNEMLETLPIYVKKNIFQLNLLLKEATDSYHKIKRAYLATISKWTASEKLIMTDWLDTLEKVEKLSIYVENFMKESPSNIVKWLVVREKHQQVVSYISDFSASLVDDSYWYDHFQKILYTGGTIRIGKDTQFLARSLGIEKMPFKSLPTSYDYGKQAKVYIPLESFAYQELHSEEYIHYITKTIHQLAKQENKRLLVLFTSHDMLQKVYQKLHFPLLVDGIEVLGQGLSGSREKIMKRFVRSNHTILLGTDSFWEGVDLPGESLEIIVITRLPFESPERPFVKEKYQYLEEKGIHSFYNYALPKATLRLRQGLGRLIRSETDKGVLIVLDRRLATATYSSKMIHALPKDLPVIECTLEDMFKDIHDFL